MRTIFLQALGVWGAMVFLAILNAIIREAVLVPAVGDADLARQLNSITAVAMFFAATYAFFRLTSAEYTEGDLLLIGGMWFVLTVTFEFMFGHYVMGHSWSYLIGDYNILNGRTWPLVLAVTALMPWLTGKYVVGGVAVAGVGGLRRADGRPMDR